MRNHLLALVLASLTALTAFGQPSLLGLGSADAAPIAGVARPPAPAAPAAPRFITGFNQAWLRTAYGHQWTASWDEAEARRMIAATREHGGRVIRMWLFEGREVERAIAPEKLAHIERFLEIAEEHGVQVYLTLFDANVVSQHPEQRHRDRYWNLLTNDHGAGDEFLENAVKPVMQAAARHPAAIFGVDLMNEHNAMVTRWWFRDGSNGARAWVRKWRAFIRGVHATPVTASFGWHDGMESMLDGRLPEADVDFYDVHVYSSDGALPRMRDLTAFIRRTARPVYLGEFGQSQSEFDDALQARLTEAFLRNAHAAGCAGALAWRLSDIRPGFNPEARHSYEAFGRWRPAAAVFRRVSDELR